MHVHVSHPDGEAKFWMSPEPILDNPAILEQLKQAVS